jgi:hypothetical protein
MEGAAQPEQVNGSRDSCTAEPLNPFLRSNFATYRFAIRKEAGSFLFTNSVSRRLWTSKFRAQAAGSLSLQVLLIGFPEQQAEVCPAWHTGLSFLTKDVRAIFDECSKRGILRSRRWSHPGRVGKRGTRSSKIWTETVSPSLSSTRRRGLEAERRAQVFSASARLAAVCLAILLLALFRQMFARRAKA